MSEETFSDKISPHQDDISIDDCYIMIRGLYIQPQVASSFLQIRRLTFLSQVHKVHHDSQEVFPSSSHRKTRLQNSNPPWKKRSDNKRKEMTTNKRKEMTTDKVRISYEEPMGLPPPCQTQLTICLQQRENRSSDSNNVGLLDPLRHVPPEELHFVPLDDIQNDTSVTKRLLQQNSIQYKSFR